MSPPLWPDPSDPSHVSRRTRDPLRHAGPCLWCAFAASFVTVVVMGVVMVLAGVGR